MGLSSFLCNSRISTVSTVVEQCIWQTHVKKASKQEETVEPSLNLPG